MNRIYIDMDGVLADWDTNSSVKDTHKLGYFMNRTVNKNVENLIDMLMTKYRVEILSAAYRNIHARIEKFLWIKRYISSTIPCTFVPYGKPKWNYISNDDAELNILIDDYTKNLKEWESRGSNYVGIKFYNGINGTHGTWKGYGIYEGMSPATMYDIIEKAVGVDTRH